MSTDPVAHSKDNSRLLKDAGVAVALLLALGIVFVWDRTRPTPSTETSKGVTIVTPKEDDKPTLPSAPAVRLRIGVIQGEFDEMGKLLKSLGEGYQFTKVELDELINPETYDKYDFLLVTCGGYTNTWLGESKGTESRGQGLFAAKPEIWDKVGGYLRAFVKRGGTLYASDLRFSLIALTFDEFVDQGRADEGQQQTVIAEVTDPGLRELLGQTIPLKFDQPDWRPAAFKGDTVVTYLNGRYKSKSDRDRESPLLVKFPFGDGAVIFTSFHNEKQNSDVEVKLLKYLVFATVTAQTEAKITKKMLEGGFSPSGSNLLSASAENPSVTRKWHCTKKGAVQFVLGFQNNSGAKLKLTVVGPNGQRAEKEGTSTLEIDLPEAVPGEWSYTVTALQVPYANFPFTLTIGEK
ncbi:MAG: hypothetical protein ACKV2Q_25345 [Planctomycetaceae bacterium]